MSEKYVHPKWAPTPKADAAIAEIEAERDALPDRISAAIEAGDDQTLAGLMVRERILDAKLETARADKEAERIEWLRSEMDRLEAEFNNRIDGVEELDLAVDVYTQAAAAKRQAAEPYRLQLGRVRDALWGV